MNFPLLALLPMVAAQGPGCLPGQPCGPLPRVAMPGLQRPSTPCPPLGPPSPILAGRVIAPEGVKVTIHPGSPMAKTFDVPVNVGFRPGYAYQLELTNLPNRPGETLYPILEVRGSLVPRAGMKIEEFPAPIYVSRADIERAISGGLVTKVVYLEDPTKAVPIDSRADLPLENTDLTEDDAMKSAAGNGRIVAVLRFGDRKPDREDLARFVVPGTVVLPGETLSPAAVAPMFAHCGIPFYDPILGPKIPTEECFTDGGDVGPRIGIGLNGKVGGLDPTDVSLAYTVLGKRRVSTTNQVCICSPRYMIRRVDVIPGGFFLTAGPDGLGQYIGKGIASTRQPAQAVMNREKPVGNVARVRPGITVSINGVHEFIGNTAPRMIASSENVGVVSMAIEPEEITSFPNELTVTKSVEAASPVKSGDEVTFTFRYRNGTRSPVTDLLLSDSLSGRLEYVTGSAQSDRPANITTTPNEAGSVIVRFELPGPVPAGQTGVVKFRAKVR